MARFAVIAVGVSLALVLSGCSEPRPLPTPTSSASESAAPAGDGVLRIGTLFAMSGDVASVGAGMVAAVEVAVRDINAAGGVLGQPVEVFYRDSGSADGSAIESGFADLRERDVDVILGPTSAALAERLASLATDAGVTVISPSTLFSPPAENLIGLVASAEYQAEALVNAIADEGGESVALISSATALGRVFESAARAALEARGMRLAAVEQLDAATNPARLAFSVAGAEPDAIILASDSSLVAQHPAIVTALTDRGVTGDQLWMTAPALADYSTTVAAGRLAGAHGVREGATVSDELLARLQQSDPAVVSARFAPEAYDAVVLAALAAEIAGDDSGPSIAALVRAAAAEGIACRSYGECLAVLETEPQVDYEGLSGPLTISPDGAVTAATLSLYRYTAENRPELVGPLVSISP